MQTLQRIAVGVLLIAVTFSCWTVAPQAAEKRVKPRGTVNMVYFGETHLIVTLNVTEALVGRDATGNLIAELAFSWNWVDATTLEFRLRQWVKFHNGEPFNAQAVRQNWEAYTKLPERFTHFGPPQQSVLEILDPATIRFRLPHRDATTLQRFRWFRLYAPAYLAQGWPENTQWSDLRHPGPWGTGPFRLMEGFATHEERASRIVLEANPSYWDPRYPRLHRLILDHSFATREAALKQVMTREGVVDVVVPIRPTQTLKVAQSPSAKVMKHEASLFYVALFNQRKRQSPWTDLRLRHALNYAVNRDDLLRYGALGNGRITAALIPPGAFGHNPTLRPYPYDPVKARQLLAQAGHAKGLRVKLLLEEGEKTQAQMLKVMFESVGLRVELELLFDQAFKRKTFLPSLDTPVAEQDWDLALIPWADFAAHLSTSLHGACCIAGGFNQWTQPDPEMEAVYQEMLQTWDSDKQEALIQKLEQMLYDHAHVLFLYEPLLISAINKYVNPLRRDDRRWFEQLRELSVTDNHWSVRKPRRR